MTLPRKKKKAPKPTPWRKTPPVALQKPRRAMKRVGVVGRANIEARRRISEICESLNLNRCEIQLEGCLSTFPLAPAHRHKRAWYHGDKDKLADFKQWVAACQNCHDRIENEKELTEEVFQKLRGAE